MKSRKFTAFVIASILAISGAASGSAAIESVGDPGRFWSIPNNNERGQVVMQFLDNTPGEIASMLLPNKDVGRYPKVIQRVLVLKMLIVLPDQSNSKQFCLSVMVQPK